jgi:hypothetical protein
VGDEEFPNAIGLADFLTDLRAELREAIKRADGDPLKLGIEELTVALDVGITIAGKAGASATAKAKFWVFASAEATVQGEASRQKVTTQHLTLKLKPRIDEGGTSRGVDVNGAFADGEAQPDLPH